MAVAPQNIVDQIKPYVNCPNALWECIVQFESGFNPLAVSSDNTSFGLFQLRINGQADPAIAYIQNTTGLYGWAANNYLLQHVDIQAAYGMPAINDAWNKLKDTFHATDRNWWLQFCAASGHPGGSITDPVTQGYVDRFMSQIVQTNTFGIGQMTSGSDSGNSSLIPNNGWLQALVNMSPHQSCSVIWRRSCPGAKSADEGGIDLPSPNGTVVYALGDGFVVGAGYFFHPDGSPGYGVVTIRTTSPDGSVDDIYYQHIDISTSIILCNQSGGSLYGNVVGPAPTFQQITKGQPLGTVVVGLVEVGFNAEWGGIWGNNPHPNQWLDDPEDKIRSLMLSGGGVSSSTININTGNDALNNAVQTSFQNAHAAIDSINKHPGLAGPIQLFDTAQQFTPFSVPAASNSNVPIIGGIESGLSYPTRLAIGVISFIVKNAMAFFIRSFFVIVTFIVIVALIINMTSRVSSSVEEDITGDPNATQDIAKIAEVAAL